MHPGCSGVQAQLLPGWPLWNPHSQCIPGWQALLLFLQSCLCLTLPTHVSWATHLCGHICLVSAAEAMCKTDINWHLKKKMLGLDILMRSLPSDPTPISLLYHLKKEKDVMKGWVAGDPIPHWVPVWSWDSPPWASFFLSLKWSSWNWSPLRPFCLYGFMISSL